MSGNRRENGTEETTKQQQHQNKNKMFSGFIRKWNNTSLETVDEMKHVNNIVFDNAIECYVLWLSFCEIIKKPSLILGHSRKRVVRGAPLNGNFSLSIFLGVFIVYHSLVGSHVEKIYCDFYSVDCSHPIWNESHDRCVCVSVSVLYIHLYYCMYSWVLSREFRIKKHFNALIVKIETMDSVGVLSRKKWSHTHTHSDTLSQFEWS